MIFPYLALPTKRPVMPLLAVKVGIDLTGAPKSEACPVGETIVSNVYARVTLCVTEGMET